MMPTRAPSISITDKIQLGGDRLVIFAGPCAIETEDLTLQVAKDVKAMGERLDIDVVFKASYDKANRTSIGSYRSAGMDEGLRILQRVKDEFEMPVITDVHESGQIPTVAEVADVVQIPAFLCRQTDLLIAAGKSGRAVNIKRGQFMAARDMRFAVQKVQQSGNPNVFLTERGVTFGYHDLIVDMRSFPIMREFAPVVYDVTHSIQQPGAMDGSSGGARWLAAPLAQGAVAVGVDGLFLETHPDPDNALSDGPNMIPTGQLEGILAKLKAIWELSR
ncbi:2-dehydro-3-deoxyphosphooctonate aldolase (KDO 8-P synthase) [Pontimonas salivibrio]|uniref:2-dehydro-3-deoxyphosphooctonate aldolase n=1 Tax=Pontimonas salivibrio TaxID=1159327 RepID=A0A2L2BNC3_9MICO|nr:3-deoxy-8-phosphooctulonate synthase [Pontimonas salivibrio]AVG23164.1 2-dehydro-3-deoxyphosphooctonate aldolase (KDO 8-P synthase) [Pontimonas salivibrio]